MSQVQLNSYDIQPKKIKSKYEINGEYPDIQLIKTKILVNQKVCNASFWEPVSNLKSNETGVSLRINNDSKKLYSISFKSGEKYTEKKIEMTGKEFKEVRNDYLDYQKDRDNFQKVGFEYFPEDDCLNVLQIDNHNQSKLMYPIFNFIDDFVAENDVYRFCDEYLENQNEVEMKIQDICEDYCDSKLEPLRKHISHICYDRLFNDMSEWLTDTAVNVLDNYVAERQKEAELEKQPVWNMGIDL